ncbi:MAG: retroviral-like aspartic protease [Planctomycetes bacterium]|nr:retroviral-like aspartic protease [Planctomycetota bacterium]
MGDIIERLRVRTIPRGGGRPLRLCFDTGSLHSFVKASAAARLGNVLELGEPQSFGGLGDGHFAAREIVHFEARLLDFWCPHYAYVVDDRVLGDDYDMLAGHGFMQGFDVRCDPRKRRIVLNRSSLRLAQTVR